MGQPVEVIAFVYHGKDGPQDGRFMAARFVVAWDTPAAEIDALAAAVGDLD